MSISVIIPTYNGDKYLAQTLQSVQAQTHTDWELIVIDDGSKDSTAALAETFASEDSRIRVVRQENGGIARARNRGIAEADPKRPYLGFLDHDDLWEATTLETQLETLKRFDHALGVQEPVRVIDTEGKPLHDPKIEDWFSQRKGLHEGKLQKLTPGMPTTLEVMALRSQILTVGQVVLRKEALHEMELFDPEMVPADDYDFWLRLLLRGELAYNPQAVVSWRKHASNTSGDTGQMIAQDRKVRDKVLSLPEITPEQQKILREGELKHHLELAELRIEWAKVSLRQRRLVGALKHLRHALKDYHIGNQNAV